MPHGQVREVWYNSKVTGTWRHALVYLPPDYDTKSNVRYLPPDAHAFGSLREANFVKIAFLPKALVA